MYDTCIQLENCMELFLFHWKGNNGWWASKWTSAVRDRRTSFFHGTENFLAASSERSSSRTDSRIQYRAQANQVMCFFFLSNLADKSQNDMFFRAALLLLSSHDSFHMVKNNLHTCTSFLQYEHRTFHKCLSDR